MRRLVAVCLAMALASCGWTSGTRLIPISERVTPDLPPELVFEAYTITPGRRLADNMVELVLHMTDGETTREQVAFDHLRRVRTDYELRDYYLTETDIGTPGEEPNFRYDLVEVTQGIDSDGSLIPGLYMQKYDLRCSDTSDRFDNNPDQQCRFSRYSDLMAAVQDVLVWMEDPRINLQSEGGGEPVEE